MRGNQMRTCLDCRRRFAPMNDKICIKCQEDGLLRYFKKDEIKLNKVNMNELHIIYTYNGKVHKAFKRWTFKHCEDVLTRLGATYWEIGIKEVIK
jgi:predicted amidophosphoribosyltransferase